MHNYKKIHLTGICGTAMGSFAGMLKEKGFDVTGSDQNVYPPMSDQLKRLGIHLLEGYKEENVAYNPDLVIVGNTTKRDNPEVKYVFEKGLKYMSFPAAFAEICLKDKTSIVVSGTHGKSTLTSLMAWILDYAGTSPSFFVGGIPKNFEKSYKLASGNYFVSEGDEYDTAFFDKRPKFLHYQPYHTIITSIEYDHADIYQSLAQIIREFENLIELIPKEGSLTVCVDCNNVRDIIKKANCAVDTYGFSKDAKWSGSIQKIDEEGMEFSVTYQGNAFGTFSSSIVGEHNLLNTLGAIALANRLGISLESIRGALKTFTGVKRRQEIRGIVNDIIVIDDFAHHPTAIEETIKAIKRRYSKRKVWAIFEPRTNSTRRNIFEKELGTCFVHADEVIIAPVFRPEAIKEEERLNVDTVLKKIREQGKQAHYPASVTAIIEKLSRETRKGDVILIMSNGGFENIHERLLTALKATMK